MTMQQYVHLFDAKEDKTNIHIQRSVSTNPRTDQSTQISLKMMAKAFQSKKILKVLYKHIFRKHFSKQLHHLCRLTVSHLAPPPPPRGKIKKNLCEAFNLFRYQAEQSSNSLQFNRHHIQIYVLQSHHFYQKQMFMDWTVLSVYKNQKFI